MAINRIRADIDLDAILYNMESMHNKLKPGTMMAAVVKADGYGHGAEAVSEVLEPLPYLWGYAVATSNEAMQLIAAGRKKPILILGLSFPEQFEEIGTTMCARRYVHMRQLRSYRVSLSLRIKPVRYISR